MDEEEGREFAADLEQLAARREGWNAWIWRCRHKDGHYRYLESNAVPILDDAGRFRGYIGSDRDVTERIEGEAERERLLEREREQNERLRELDRLKDNFVASVSHELRTPLTSIRGYLELVREGEVGELNPEQDAFLGVVDRNADRLLRVVTDLLFVAQVDAQKVALELEQLPLAELAHQAVEAARPAAEARSVALELFGGQPLVIRGDRARLGQALDNLVSNALKFTPPGGRVEVRLREDGGRALVEVTDTGIGIAAHEQERLFERFFRTTSANEHAIQGTGLGLWIAKAIVDAHGGAISVESEEGVGSTFRFSLPLEPQLAAPDIRGGRIRTV